MEQFAFTHVHPLRIAWLIRYDDWDHLEKVIYYNCTILGGYFNVVIPITEHNTLSEEYQQFLTDYDPDFIVLVPGMVADQLEHLSVCTCPFDILSWESAATLGPQRGVNEIYELADIPTIERRSYIAEAFVATADKALPDTSRLALVACGDVKPLRYAKDEEDRLRATGDREDFLARLLAEGYSEEYVRHRFGDDGQEIPPPNRYQLSDLILEKYKFPLSKAVAILRTCYKLQTLRDSSTRQCFIGLTAAYYNDYWDRSKESILILISDSFSLEEAVLFWNLRANGRYVAWLSFSDLEKDLNAIAKWLDSGPEDVFSDWGVGSPCSVTFVTKSEEIPRAQAVVNLLQTTRIARPNRYGGNYEAPMVVKKYEDLISYDFRPSEMRRDHIMVIKNEDKYTFLPNLPKISHYSRIVFTVTLEWNGVMFPSHNQIIQRGNPSKTFQINNSRVDEQNICVPQFRITSGGYLKSLIDAEYPLEFIRPLPEQAVQMMFESAGFARIEPSSTAKYHTIFINRAGGLDQAAYYLSKSPYWELLNILAENESKNKPGWLLDSPAERRVLHHLFLRKLLGETTPDSTKEYFNTVSDKLPAQAFHLLEKGLLERGFLLRCRTCSFDSWYPAEHIGQTFECARCFQTQVYDSNPLWLYKLPEVIFQGFADNMQVPILALNYLKSKSQYYFEWIPDSNVYRQANDKKILGNIDLLCLCDGRLYIGEAKRNAEIEKDQFSFYEQICRSVTLDGIVFATSQTHWDRGTQQLIDRLKAWFRGEVLILTEKDLYRNKDIL